jgi:hypothetical protein
MSGDNKIKVDALQWHTRAERLVAVAAFRRTAGYAHSHSFAIAVLIVAAMCFTLVFVIRVSPIANPAMDIGIVMLSVLIITVSIHRMLNASKITKLGTIFGWDMFKDGTSCREVMKINMLGILQLGLMLCLVFLLALIRYNATALLLLMASASLLYLMKGECRYYRTLGRGVSEMRKAYPYWQGMSRHYSV